MIVEMNGICSEAPRRRAGSINHQIVTSINSAIHKPNLTSYIENGCVSLARSLSKYVQSRIPEEELIHNKIYTQEELNFKIDFLCDKFLEKYKIDHEICCNVEKLRNFGHDLASFVEEYDIRPGVQANGYRSILQLGLLLIEYGIKTFNDCKDKSNLSNSQFFKDYKLLVGNYVSAIKYVERMRDESNNNLDDQKEFKPDVASSTELAVDLTYDYLKSDKSREVHFSSHNFLVPNSLVKFGIELSIFVSSLIHSGGLISTIRCLLSKEYRRKVLTQVGTRYTMSELKSQTSGWEKIYLFRVLYPNAVNGNKPTIQKFMDIERSNIAVIECDTKNRTSPKIRMRGREERLNLTKKFVKCKFFYEPVDPKDYRSDPKVLIINVHGGGFCLGSLEANDVFLRYWARKLPGVGVLSIDVSLAPEKEFPAAVQDIIDVYLTIIKSNRLGFRPRKIFLSGDSSGAYQCMSALIVLNEIKKLSPITRFMMPKAVISLYASYTCDAVLVPSYMMCTTNLIMNPFLMTQFGEAYLVGEEGKIKQNNHKNDAPEDYNVPSYLKFFGRQFKALISGNIVPGIFRTIAKVLSYIVSTSGLKDPVPAPIPIFARTKEQILENVTKLYPISRHPLCSPIYYNDFESLSDITLYLVCCQFDPVLDHSVIIGRKWKGELIVDVFNNMPHGFMNGIGSNVCRKANDIVLERIRKLCYE